MSSLELLYTLNLSNGLSVRIFDHTKVYFGDYHHVRLEIICTFDTAAFDWLKCIPGNVDLRSISYTRTLEKMGVSSVDIKSVIRTLVNDFDRNSLPYISSADFPKKMLVNELSSKKAPALKYIGAGT